MLSVTARLYERIVLSVPAAVILSIITILNAVAYVLALLTSLTYKTGSTFMVHSSCTWSCVWREGDVYIVSDLKSNESDVVVIVDVHVTMRTDESFELGLFRIIEKSYETYVDVLLPSGAIRSCTSLRTFAKKVA